MIPLTRRAHLLGAFSLVACMAASCMQSSKESQTDEATSQSASRPSFGDFAAGAPMIGLATEGQAAARKRSASQQTAPTQGPSQLPTSSQPAAPGMIIRNGDVLIQVDSTEIAVASIRQLATSVGGYIGNVSTLTGARQVRSATLEMKVPAGRFDEAMSGMSPLGKVERSTATAEEVGEEFVDLSARIANARRLEARLVALLAQRTGKLEDVLAVERELARVREEIERYEGRLRYLSTRVATSTIVATVHEKAPLVASQPGTNVLGNAFLNMWRNFVAFVAYAIELLGVLVPVLGLTWGGLAIARRWRRSRTPAAA